MRLSHCQRHRDCRVCSSRPCLLALAHPGPRHRGPTHTSASVSAGRPRDSELQCTAASGPGTVTCHLMMASASRAPPNAPGAAAVAGPAVVGGSAALRRLKRVFSSGTILAAGPAPGGPGTGEGEVAAPVSTPGGEGGVAIPVASTSGAGWPLLHGAGPHDTDVRMLWPQGRAATRRRT
jgi:hypothetical protein